MQQETSGQADGSTRAIGRGKVKILLETGDDGSGRGLPEARGSKQANVDNPYAKRRWFVLMSSRHGGGEVVELPADLWLKKMLASGKENRQAGKIRRRHGTFGAG